MSLVSLNWCVFTSYVLVYKFDAEITELFGAASKYWGQFRAAPNSLVWIVLGQPNRQ